MRAPKKTVIIVILFLLLNPVAYTQEAGAPGPETAGARPDQAGQAKEANRLPLEKEGWQFIVAPYLWLPGVNIGISKQGTRGATASVSVPWYDLVPDLFSKVIGAMGRVEVQKDRWGFFVDNVFMYVGDSVNWRRFQKNKSSQRPRARSPDNFGELKTHYPSRGV